MQTEQVVSTKPLLRPDQVESAKEEISSLEAKLKNPLIQDKGEVQRQLGRARRAFEEQTPRAPESSEEEGKLATREKQLLGEILVGMPSQEEMRKAPPGAVDKHMEWERRNKTKILEWKNIRLRLTAGSNERDIANLEKYRPRTSTLNMDSAQIQGKQFFMPETTSPSVVFSDDQLALLRKLSPELADSIALMTNDQRGQVKDTLNGIGLATEVKPEKKKGGRPRKKQVETKQE